MNQLGEENAEGKPRTAELMQAAKFLKKHGVHAYEELIEKCPDAGVKIDAIGLQSHQQGTVNTDEKGLAEVTGFKGEYHRNVSQSKRFLRCFSGQGEALA